MKKLILTTSIFGLLAATPALAQNADAPTAQPAPTQEQSQGTATGEEPVPMRDTGSEGAEKMFNYKDNEAGSAATGDTAASDKATDDGATAEPAQSTASEQSEPAVGQGEQPRMATGPGWRASNLIGKQVLNAEGEAIGDINDFILDDQGKVAHVLVGVGGFLGLGEKIVPLDMSQFNVQRGDDDALTVTTDATRASLESATEWKDSDAGY